MIKTTQGVAALIVLCVLAHSSAQTLDPAALETAAIQTFPTPEPINLDIPPEEAPDPSQVQAEELATQAALNPNEFHDWLLEMEPGRLLREQVAAFAILNPGEFRRAHPKTPEQVQAEFHAARALFRLLGPLPWLPSSN